MFNTSDQNMTYYGTLYFATFIGKNRIVDSWSYNVYKKVKTDALYVKFVL